LSKNGQLRGHAFSAREPRFPDTEPETAKSPDETPSQATPQREGSFEDVFRAFVSQMETYRRFMPLTLDLSPEIAKLIAEREVIEFASQHGLHRPDLSSATAQVYELDSKLLREYWFRQEKVASAIGGSQMLPPIMIIGLVSAYDSFLASLLKVVFTKHEELC
jgi:hypothetical protein